MLCFLYGPGEPGRYPATNESDAVRFSVLQLLALLAVCALALAVWVALKNRWDQPHLLALRTQLLQFASATNCYRETLGEYPPACDPEGISEHLSNCYPDLNTNDLLGSRRTLNDIDDRESLVLWLRDAPALAKLGGDPRVSYFFDFDPSRLVDTDQDGWLEYVSEFETVFHFHYWDASTSVFCPRAGRILRSDE